MAAGDNVVEGTRVADIQVSTTYPIVSAYEFEFLKTEEIIRERLDACTLYLIVQRPLTYFDNVEMRDGYIYFQISDGRSTALCCRINPVTADLCADGEAVDIELNFFSKLPGKVPPFRDVGGIKVFKADGSFVVWWSPQKILYEMLVNGLPVEVADDGDPLTFLDFKVHYIGKAFSQKVWNRLTGHEKMQRILTLQGPIGASPEAKAPFEISLILLSVVGLTDVPAINAAFTLPPDVKPILHRVDLDDDDSFDRFFQEPPVQLGDEALTKEVEAMLIHQFQPEENEIKFKTYPEIKGGMRSKGYSATSLTIERLPARLYTDHHSIAPVVVTV